MIAFKKPVRIGVMAFLVGAVLGVLGDAALAVWGLAVWGFAVGVFVGAASASAEWSTEKTREKLR